MILVVEVANEDFIGTDLLRAHGMIMDFALATESWVSVTLRGKNQEDKFLMARTAIQGSVTIVPVEVMNHLKVGIVLYKHTQMSRD